MELLNKIFNAGIVGAGGAGFPTHIKLNCTVEYLLINAAECEPLLNTDKYIMNTYPKELVKAVEETGKLVSAKEIYIAVKGVNETEISNLNKAIKETGSAVKIFPLDNYYPAGDEQMIVYDITKRTVPPGGIPLNVGVAVSNIATMLNVYDAISDKPVTHKFLTVTGEVATPTVLKVPIGMSYRECIEICGGATVDAYQIVSGGPMMGKVYYKEELESLYVTKTTSGIILIKDSNNFIANLKNTDIKKLLNRAKSACIQCSFCTDLCPRNLIGHEIRPHRVMRYMSNLDFSKPMEYNEITKEALICCECGICEAYACPMALSPRQVNIFVKKQLAPLGKRYETDKTNYTASPLRDYRKITPVKLVSKMGLGNLYKNKAKNFLEMSTSKVSISLKQNIGIPSTPCVNVNDKVTEGDLIAKGEFDKVSANVHASISGIITKINGYIEIIGGE